LDPVESLGEESKNVAKRRELPAWVKEQITHWGESICVPEWDADEYLGDSAAGCGCDEAEGYRSKNGWKGADLCHSEHSPVRISHYRVRYSEGGVGTVLTGVCHFTPRAESHAGYCHGGSMTSVMDDVIGWTAFLVTGECIPWSGFTAQVNVSLKRPIAVGSYLKITGKVVRREGRKVWIHAELLCCDGGNEGGGEEILHCTGEGLVILKKPE